MVTRQHLVSGASSGVIGGVILGFFLKVVQTFTGIKVYTLLLNVDFLPILGRVIWSEFVEFFFHLCISFLLGMIYSFIPKTKTHPYITSFIITIPTIPLFYVLIHLSIKETVSITDLTGFLLWTIGHILFAFSLAASYQYLTKKMTT
ncbi:hypothetical protein [Bacillus suaedaesalsae]|uniref:DUF3021 domain-containing protein n=1 Tax=Bacillus suaedaesalsae TaxID=2810349 RepID=A0ABS2DJE0_9BACI|nr:hypothetical protein [Bacillus suaedaesalsae]MBM6618604.1 hypothetical protein [Bacillus suaedaesalsae]